MLDFKYIVDIKKQINKPEVSIYKQLTTLTKAEWYDIMNNGLNIEDYITKKYQVGVNQIKEERQRNRKFLTNTDEDKAPGFNKHKNDPNYNWNKSYTVVNFHGHDASSQYNMINKLEAKHQLQFKNHYRAPQDLNKVEAISREIDNAGQAAKIVFILMKETQMFTNLDYLIMFHRVINKLKRHKRKVFIITNKIIKVREAFKPAKDMKLTSPHLVSQMAHYINEDTTVNLSAERMPSKRDFGGFIPYYTGEQLITDAEYLPNGTKIVATRDAEKRDYKLMVTHNELSCDCRYCPKSYDCQYANKYEVTELVHRNYHANKMQEMLDYIEEVEREEQRIKDQQYKSSMKYTNISYIDKVDILKMFGVYNPIESDGFEEFIDDSQLVNERMFESLMQVPDEDLIDFESLAQYDRAVDGSYNEYEFGERRYHKLLISVLGEEKAKQIHEKLTIWKENNNIEYFGKTEYMLGVSE